MENEKDESTISTSTYAQVEQVSDASFAILQQKLKNLATSIIWSHIPAHKAVISRMVKSCFQEVAKKTELGGEIERGHSQSFHAFFFGVDEEELWQEETQEGWIKEDQITLHYDRTADKHCYQGDFGKNYCSTHFIGNTEIFSDVCSWTHALKRTDMLSKSLESEHTFSKFLGLIWKSIPGPLPVMGKSSFISCGTGGKHVVTGDARDHLAKGFCLHRAYPVTCLKA